MRRMAGQPQWKLRLAIESQPFLPYTKCRVTSFASLLRWITVLWWLHKTRLWTNVDKANITCDRIQWMAPWIISPVLVTYCYLFKWFLTPTAQHCTAQTITRKMYHQLEVVMTTDNADSPPTVTAFSWFTVTESKSSHFWSVMSC